MFEFKEKVEEGQVRTREYICVWLEDKNCVDFF